MADKRPKPQCISEHILEVRFAPNPTILDYRGSWAEMIKDLMGLSHWRIGSNRIDLFDNEENPTITAFVSFRNCGFVIQDSPTRNYFSDQAIKLLKFLFQQKAFGDSIKVPRIGVRTRFATCFDGTFESLYNQYSTKFVAISPAAAQIFGEKMVDIGLSLTLESQFGKVNTTSGPMSADQLKAAFPLRDDVPDVALYLDLDYYKEPKNAMTVGEISTTVKHYAENAWNINESIVNLVTRSRP
jgi:hypothetical protein